MEFTQEVQKSTDPIYQKISKVMPEIEWSVHAPYIHKINKLKKEKNAVILAHNYQTPEIYHGVADFAADSLALAIEASKTSADIILMAGVHFMAETAKLMSPEKKVILPDMDAGCSLSSSITGKDVRLLKEKYPGVPVVSYVNTSAEVKAETDVCCTSANAVKIVKSLGVKKVIFLPDDYLAKYVASQTDVEIISWKGICIVHDQFNEKEINGAYLHRFSWLEDSEVGKLDHTWNYLVGVYDDIEKPKLIHYTEGGPWFENYRDCEFNELWKQELYDMFK